MVKIASGSQLKRVRTFINKNGTTTDFEGRLNKAILLQNRDNQETTSEEEGETSQEVTE